MSTSASSAVYYDPYPVFKRLRDYAPLNCDEECNFCAGNAKAGIIGSFPFTATEV